MIKFSIEDLNYIPPSEEKTEKKQSFFLYKNLIVSNSNSLDSYDTNNNSKSLSNIPSIGQKENFNNHKDDKNILNIKDTIKGKNKVDKKINFLRKKTKNKFIITRQTEKKPKFLTTEYIRKNVNFFFEKDINKDIKKIFPKKKMFRTCKYFYQDDSIKNTNEGRWSYEEHIKFIESFVNYGKKWELIQKYIGTRSCRQIRSHAQKFLLRLKGLNTDKFCFDLRKSNVQSLSDVINLIAKSNKTNKNNKEYIKDTLIALTKLNLENHGQKFFERKNDNLIIEIKKEEAVNDKISKIDDKSPNKTNNNNKKLEFNDFISGIDLIKDEAEDEVEDEELILDKNSYLEERYINYNFLLNLKENEKNVINNNDIINYGQNWNSNYEYMNNPMNINFIGNNNSLSLSVCSSFSNIDNAFIEPKNHIFKKNIKSTFLKFMV